MADWLMMFLRSVATGAQWLVQRARTERTANELGERARHYAASSESWFVRRAAWSAQSERDIKQALERINVNINW